MVREYLNNHPVFGGAFGLAVLSVVIGLIYYMQVEKNDVQRALTLAWYSDDDGKSWYSDNKNLNPPFDRGGKTVVRAFVFRCTGDNHEFVGYLQRYAASAKKAIEDAHEQVVEQKIPPPIGLYESIEKNGLEVKRPGDADWVNVRDPKAKSIEKVTCPSGGTVEQVSP
jgi:hypothetical protein